jgi:hypothetical protein
MVILSENPEMQNSCKRGRDDPAADNVPAKRVQAGNEEAHWNVRLPHAQPDPGMEITTENVDVPMTDALVSPQLAQRICYGAVGLVPLWLSLTRAHVFMCGRNQFKSPLTAS